MSKGFLWFAQNNDNTDYGDLSHKLAMSIKKWNKHNSVCVITDSKTKINDQYVDHLIVMDNDESKDQHLKFSNEYKAFSLTPFTHTIKLEADMLFTSNTDEWWNHLGQHDMVFSIHCRNFKDNVIKNSPYRKLFKRNMLPDVYNGLFYFRRSIRAKQFFDICKSITLNWNKVKDTLLVGCHDTVPTTDVVYGLALRIMDPISESLIDYPWFKFIHNKAGINNTEHAVDQNNYLYPIQLNDRTYLGGNRIDRLWHYYEKNTSEVLNDRIF